MQKARCFLEQNNLRSPDEGVELSIYEAFQDWKKNSEQLNEKLTALRKKCSLKLVFIYFEILNTEI